MNISWYACVSIALAVLARSSAAMAVPSNDLTALSLEQLLDVQVVAASRFSQNASDAPSAITTINADDIRVFGYRTLGDIIQGVRSFVVTSDGNTAM